MGPIAGNLSLPGSKDGSGCAAGAVGASEVSFAAAGAEAEAESAGGISSSVTSIDGAIGCGRGSDDGMMLAAP